MSPVDQHGTEGQTHGRAGGVRDAQTGIGERPMIHVRRTHQISPGRQADAVSRMHEWVAIFKEAAGIVIRVSVVTTGTLGRICSCEDVDGLAAKEAADTKAFGSPKGKALITKSDQDERDGTASFVPGTANDEFWRYS